MDKFDRKIARSIQQDPAYDCLDKLGPGVWQKIRATKAHHTPYAWLHFPLTPAIKTLTLVLFLGSFLALSQISFEKGVEPDLFDLRYLSHQSLVTANLLSNYDQGPLP